LASKNPSVKRGITNGTAAVIYTGNTGEMSLLRVLVMLTPR